MEALHFLAAPLVMATLLLLIHAYLGLHVLEREVLFVDISLSQIAALGGAVSLFFSAEEDNTLLAIPLSLSFCFFAALALAWLRQKEKTVSQEALIGMSYAFASGAMILVADKLPHGAEHIKEALIGNILFVTWPQVFKTFLIYAVVSLVHYAFRKQFWMASRGVQKSFFWDFFFYFLFGVVITFSTQHAGVLVVFAILVAPASLAKSFFPEKDRMLARLLTAWMTGLSGILMAFALSYNLDFPTGATIVCTLTLLFFAVIVGRARFGVVKKK